MREEWNSAADEIEATKHRFIQRLANDCRRSWPGARITFRAHDSLSISLST